MLVIIKFVFQGEKSKSIKKVNTLADYVSLQNDSRIRGAVHSLLKLGANSNPAGFDG